MVRTCSRHSCRADFRGKGSDSGGDPFRGCFSELRLWKRCLSDDELAMPINASSPPGDLVRWLCLTDEDADNTDGAVRKCVSEGRTRGLICSSSLLLLKSHAGSLARAATHRMARP